MQACCSQNISQILINQHYFLANVATQQENSIFQSRLHLSHITSNFEMMPHLKVLQNEAKTQMKFAGNLDLKVNERRYSDII